jgi:hypothetical protein
MTNKSTIFAGMFVLGYIISSFVKNDLPRAVAKTINVKKPNYTVH